MDQTSQGRLVVSDLRGKAQGFAEPRCAQADGSDMELLTHEMIQRHALG